MNPNEGFGGLEAPDGLVYAADDDAPELRWNPNQQARPAAPKPQREAPRRPERSSVQAWQPSPPPEGKMENTSPVAGIVRVMFMAAFPLGIIFVLAKVYLAFAGMYGLG